MGSVLIWIAAVLRFLLSYHPVSCVTGGWSLPHEHEARLA
jgi:hypothetical protein